MALVNGDVWVKGKALAAVSDGYRGMDSQLKALRKPEGLCNCFQRYFISTSTEDTGLTLKPKIITTRVARM
jgi:hypothetical protein